MSDKTFLTTGEAKEGQDQELLEGKTEKSQQQTPQTRIQPTSRIVGGLEWRTYGYDVCSCARCGSSCEFRDCYECGGEGIVEEDDDEDFGNESHLRRCHVCWGRCGTWHCISTPEHCEAHPIPGRENIESTALKSEAWND